MPLYELRERSKSRLPQTSFVYFSRHFSNRKPSNQRYRVRVWRLLPLSANGGLRAIGGGRRLAANRAFPLPKKDSDVPRAVGTRRRSLTTAGR